MIDLLIVLFALILMAVLAFFIGMDAGREEEKKFWKKILENRHPEFLIEVELAEKLVKKIMGEE